MYSQYSYFVDPCSLLEWELFQMFLILNKFWLSISWLQLWRENVFKLFCVLSEFQFTWIELHQGNMTLIQVCICLTYFWKGEHWLEDPEPPCPPCPHHPPSAPAWSGRSSSRHWTASPVLLCGRAWPRHRWRTQTDTESVLENISPYFYF